MNRNEASAPTLEISVVIPCYGCAAILPDLLSRTHAAMDKITDSYEVILVDDCSPDKLYEHIPTIIAQYPKLRYFELMFNVGQFRALMCGLAQAKGKYIVTMDDDLQHPPEEIAKMFHHMIENPRLDAIFGSYEQKRHSFIRNLGSLFIRWVNVRVFKKPPGLIMSAFRCMRRELVHALLANQTRYPVIGPLILSSTKRIANVTVRHDPRKHGESGYSLLRLVRTTLDNILNFSSLPLQIISLVGVAISGLSFAIGAFYLIIKLVRGSSFPGWTSLFFAINFYSGLILLSIGVIGEYLIRILGETKGQPMYVVRSSSDASPSEVDER